MLNYILFCGALTGLSLLIGHHIGYQEAYQKTRKQYWDNMNSAFKQYVNKQLYLMVQDAGMRFRQWPQFDRDKKRVRFIVIEADTSVVENLTQEDLEK